MNMSLDPSNFQTDKSDPETKTHARLLDRTGLLALGKTWDELVENAAEENAYFCRQYVEALFTHIERRKVHALTIWRDAQLIALLPFLQNRWHWGGITTLNQAWTGPYTTLSIPLIHADHMNQAIQALTTAMGDGSTGSNIWLLGDMTLEGPIGSRLAKEFGDQGHPFTTLDKFDRAILIQEGTFDEHMKTHVSKNRRKDLKRNRKRLSEQGTLTVHNCSQGAELDRAVAHFLHIEANGWKGTRGTALDCQNTTRAFAKQAFGDSHGSAITRADLLELDGKPIAVSLSLQTGRTAFTLKCAYDETYRSFSAGLLLEQDMIQEFLEGDWADRLDSATAPGHLIQGLWNSSTSIGDMLVTAGPTPLPFKFYEAMEKGRRRARAQAKKVLASIRG